MRKLQKKTKITFIILVFIIIAIVWIYYGNTVIKTTTAQVQNTEIPEAFDGFSIVQVSDLHNAQFGENQKRLVQAVEETKPDMIVITGDLIDSNRTDVEVAMEFIRQAVEIAPVYYVTGNHEVWATDAYGVLEQQMKEAGVHVLNDESITLEKDGEYIQLIGLGDMSLDQEEIMTEGNLVEKKIERLLDDNVYTILLSHRPELFPCYYRTSVNLVFSGHAHGGQFRIPFVGGLVAPDQGIFPQYTEGSFTEANTTMFVSRGLGNSIIPFRINNLPELVVVTLKSGE